MLLEQITQDLTAAMKARDQKRVDTLRYLISAIKKYEIDTYPPSTGKSVSEEEVIKIVQKQVKTHRESIEAFAKANRNDLVEKESVELEILQSYTPKELTDEEITSMVQAVITAGQQQFGAVMGTVMKQVSGRADGARVQKIVQGLLSSG